MAQDKKGIFYLINTDECGNINNITTFTDKTEAENAFLDKIGCCKEDDSEYLESRYYRDGEHWVELFYQ